MDARMYSKMPTEKYLGGLGGQLLNVNQAKTDLSTFIPLLNMMGIETLYEVSK